MIDVESDDSFDELILEGCRARKIASTSLDCSSRTAPSEAKPAPIPKRPPLNISQLSFSSEDELPLFSGSTNDSPHKDSSTNDTPHKDSSTNDSPHKDSSTNDSPHKDGSTNDSPHRDGSTHDRPHKNSSTNDSPHKDSSTNDNPHKDSSTNDSPHKDSSTDDSPHLDSSANDSPHRDSSTNDSPHKDAVLEKMKGANHRATVPSDSDSGSDLDDRWVIYVYGLSPVHGSDEPESVSTRKETISLEAASAKATSTTSEEQNEQFFASFKKNQIKREYKAIPQELEALIGRLCEEKGVKHAAWTQSADWRRVKILGIGASGIISELETKAKAIEGAEEFHFKAIESGPHHLKPLCSVKLKAELDNADKNEERTTCELLYQNKFPVTVAHGLFSKKEKEDLESGPEDTQIRRMRKLMENRPATYSLVVVREDQPPTQPPPISVKQKPEICHRWYKCKCDQCGGQQAHLHGYMNDIALFEIEEHERESDQSRLSHLFHLPDIPAAKPDEIEPRLTDVLFFVKDRECLTTAPLKSVYPHKNCFPKHIKFSISKGNRLKEGDSGSILSVDEKRQFPFAMLVAVLEDGPEDSKDASKAGPKDSKYASKAGPKDSKYASKAGPKDSKDASKAGPKDSKDENEYVTIWLKPALEEITQVSHNDMAD